MHDCNECKYNYKTFNVIIIVMNISNDNDGNGNYKYYILR